MDIEPFGELDNTNGNTRNPCEANADALSLPSIDFHPPTDSVLNQLDSVIRGQFELVEPETKVDDEKDHVVGQRRIQKSLSWLVNHSCFLAFFMVWTLYAIFVPDLDMLVGNKKSKLVISIITTFVALFFMAEILLQSCGRKKYAFRAYFWLDVIALISLLPDTYLAHIVLQKSFVAGRSSRFMRVLRITSRSSKATRLNRLTKIVRVASLVSRLQSTFGHKVNKNATEQLLTKKLRRVFHFLDEDMDGYLPRVTFTLVLDRLKPEQPKSNWRRVTKILNVGVAKRAFETVRTNSRINSQQSTSSQFSSEAPKSVKSFEETSQSAEHDGQPKEWQNKMASSLLSAVQMFNIRSKSASNTPKEEEECADNVSNLLDFENFKSSLLEDETVASRLRRICQQQLKQSCNMQNLTAWHSEYIGVKVALCVLFALYVLNLVEPAVNDFSNVQGLSICAALMEKKFPNLSVNSTIPVFVQEQVNVWINGIDEKINPREVLYLDFGRKIYCNQLSQHERHQNCGSPAYFMGERGQLEDIDDDISNSDVRVSDLRKVLVPDLSDEAVTREELNIQTTSVAVLYARRSTQIEAAMSLTTTILVSFIILSSMWMLTRDFASISRKILVPMRELADDMDNIASMQLAGVSNVEQPITEGRISEVQLIRSKFENMKMALRSWGKYVPWPVVQLLLRANAEANLEVEEEMVTMLFSDIASFTSIVEAMKPEETLLLLSRYFNDMSKIVDNHGGIVIEFIGDAILCIFGTPLANLHHPTSAVKTAQQMLNALQRLNQWGKKEGFMPVRIRCGIHTGNVLVGNMGFQERMKYGIVGEETQLAPQLETLNKTYSTSILISQDTFWRLRPGAFVTRPIDYVYLKQAPDAGSELVYEVMPDSRGSFAEAAKLYENALGLYRREKFELAASMFAEVNKKMLETTDKEDTPSTLMMARCKAYLEKSPPPTWNGVWSL